MSPTINRKAPFRKGGLGEFPRLRRNRPVLMSSSGGLFLQFFVPGTGESAFAVAQVCEQLFLARPFAPRQLIEHLDAIAIGVLDINAHGDAVVAYPDYGDVLLFDPQVELFSVLQGFHVPGHVV